MCKHTESVSHRHPSFDFLEDRSLLSAGSLWPFGGWGSGSSPPVSAVRSPLTPPVGGVSGFEGRPHGAWPNDLGMTEPGSDSPEQGGAAPAVTASVIFSFVIVPQIETSIGSVGGFGVSVAPPPASPSLVSSLGKAGPSAIQNDFALPLGATTAPADGAANVFVVSSKEMNVEISDPLAAPVGPAAAPPAQLPGADGSVAPIADNAPPSDDASPRAGTNGIIPVAQSPIPLIQHLVSSRRPRSTIVLPTSVSPDQVVTSELTGPSGADLLATALPFDRATLARAVDACFQQLESTSVIAPVGHSPSKLLLYSLATATTFAALDIVRKRWLPPRATRKVRARLSITPPEPIGFPEVPGSWSSRLS